MNNYLYELVYKGKTLHLTYEEVKRNYNITGYNHMPKQREELQGSPKIDGFLGAMWGGYKDNRPVLRYETQEVYNALSK